jgi:hypothetical protein
MFIGKWAEVEYSAETSMTYIILKDDDDYLVSYFDRNDGYSMVWYGEDVIEDYINYADNYIPSNTEHYRYIIDVIFKREVFN